MIKIEMPKDSLEYRQIHGWPEPDYSSWETYAESLKEYIESEMLSLKNTMLVPSIIEAKVMQVINCVYNKILCEWQRPIRYKNADGEDVFYNPCKKLDLWAKCLRPVPEMREEDRMWNYFVRENGEKIYLGEWKPYPPSEADTTVYISMSKDAQELMGAIGTELKF